ncbi:MAG: DUF3089 domain-containing protein [Pseudomonadota bacterium]|nr:DUF3089 domain-containing protein [Pseudomonadota bacterium]
MCARRFLILMFILTLLAVGGAFVLYQFGDQVLVRVATPTGHYQEPPKGSGPDYSKEAAWLAQPGLTSDPSQWLPDGVIAAPSRKVAAAFYVHPTTYLDRDRWNAPIDAPGEPSRRAQVFVETQAGAFNNVAELWAPKYRQAAYGAFLLNSADAKKALDLAYRDVLAAFDAFLSGQQADRPIILAGHSQGSMHLLRLLAERKNQLGGRLVAAYVVGWPVGISSDLPATGLPLCHAPAQSGCVLSWQSFREPANTRLITKAWVGTLGLTSKARSREDMLCTNPLSGTSNGDAPPASNRGTLVPNGDLTEARLESGLVGARCDKGFLIIDGDVPNLGPYVLPGNNYHVYDYALFWGAIRADAERRLTAWRKR